MNKRNLIIILFLCLLLTLGYIFYGGDAYISDFKVNDDTGSALQTNSRIGVDSAGNFVIAWTDCRNFFNNQWAQVYCQVFNKGGTRVGSNFRVGQDTAYFIDLSMTIDGRFIVYWLNQFTKVFNGDSYDLDFQRFNKNGSPLSTIKRVTDTSYATGGEPLEGGAMSIDSTGNFIICWSKPPALDSLSNIYFQRYDSSGNRLGIVQRANEVNSRAFNPQIAVNNNGSFVICWEDDRNNSHLKFNIYMQRYYARGVKIGNNVKVNDDNDTTKTHERSWVSTNGKGRFVICWTDERISQSLPKIMYQLYDTSGMSVGNNIIANTSSGQVSFPRVNMRSDGYFFIGWNDDDGYTYFGRRFTNTGNPYGTPNSPYVVPDRSFTSGVDGIKIHGDKIYSVWTDSRNGNADIYCNIRGFQNPDTTIIGIKQISGAAKEFRLDPAFPNPFNPETNIKFEVPLTKEGSKWLTVKLVIYDILGREITTLVNENKPPGTYNIKWYAVNYPSGIYFYRLTAGDPESGSRQVFSQTKKMAIIK